MKTVQDYLNEIGTEVLLTAEEENTLLLQAINGDKVAIDKIICANRRFVVSVANQYQNIGLSLLELITASEQGLTNAIMESASRSLDERFIQFAVAYMRKAIEEAIDKQSALRA
jgi:RNA polymerase primary sigma factor